VNQRDFQNLSKPYLKFGDTSIQVTQKWSKRDHAATFTVRVAMVFVRRRARTAPGLGRSGAPPELPDPQLSSAPADSGHLAENELAVAGQ
jgi:hypothetical protein